VVALSARMDVEAGRPARMARSAGVARCVP
jgi:hypothetical protein